MARSSLVWALALLVACGGDEGGAPPGTPPDSLAVDVADGGSVTSAAGQDAPELLREEFDYSGGIRDPFLSLVVSGGVKPEPDDLEVVGITFDARYPQRSVATLRDRSDGTRYTLQPGDRVGRVRVLAIRASEVVLMVEQIGEETQRVLQIRIPMQEVRQ